jgi:aspartate aminotransferase
LSAVAKAIAQLTGLRSSVPASSQLQLKRQRLTNGVGVPYTSDVPNRLSSLASELSGSAILRIAAEVRAVAATGRPVTNLTIGDFSPKEFQIPKAMEDGIVAALKGGEFNYPPSNGLESLRKAIRQFYLDRVGLDYPLESILITAGARPAIYTLYRAVVNEGDAVVYGVPSWNNNYYTEIVGAKDVAIPCDASTNFLPTAKMLEKAIRGARLLALNSPLNPTGTMFEKNVLSEICDLVLEENRRRGPNERPLYLMFDQVYWMVTTGSVPHVDPLTLRPELAPYTIVVDAISKAFAATGLRVGWALGPADVIRAMSDISGHVGAWAPRPEQAATAAMFSDVPSVNKYLEKMCRDASARLNALCDGLNEMGRAGLPVRSIKPQGAIYTSAQFDLRGRKAPDGERLDTNDAIRRYLLNAAGLGAVPFQAFGLPGDTGWFRLSIGVVSVPDIQALLPRIRKAVEATSPPD